MLKMVRFNLVEEETDVYGPFTQQKTQHFGVCLHDNSADSTAFKSPHPKRNILDVTLSLLDENTIFLKRLHTACKYFKLFSWDLLVWQLKINHDSDFKLGRLSTTAGSFCKNRLKSDVGIVFCSE